MRLLGRWMLFCAFGAVLLQLFFVARIALLGVLDPASTTVQRSQLWQLARHGTLHWSQSWQPRQAIAPNLQRAVLASEDDGFVTHQGVDWQAMQRAWKHNAQGNSLRGGSTLSQQLAKNLLLSGERSLLRKGQELVLTLALERLLDKGRILELYLNHVEWGQGVFGAEAAARHYFRKSAAELSAWEAARLAVMLPNPRGFEQASDSAYLSRRSASILARMHRTQLP